VLARFARVPKVTPSPLNKILDPPMVVYLSGRNSSRSRRDRDGRRSTGGCGRRPVHSWRSARTAVLEITSSSSAAAEHHPPRCPSPTSARVLAPRTRSGTTVRARPAVGASWPVTTKSSFRLERVRQLVSRSYHGVRPSAGRPTASAETRR